ncbi:MAG: hypothetical protein DRP73_05635 [Candidatus Omnitrophota bacterium]|nr:MAG: hypothetical protein DRP73_05635 [Candidatus Omnitrophota bacterium]
MRKKLFILLVSTFFITIRIWGVNLSEEETDFGWLPISLDVSLTGQEVISPLDLDVSLVDLPEKILTPQGVRVFLDMVDEFLRYLPQISPFGKPDEAILPEQPSEEFKNVFDFRCNFPREVFSSGDQEEMEAVMDVLRRIEEGARNIYLNTGKIEPESVLDSLGEWERTGEMTYRQNLGSYMMFVDFFEENEGISIAVYDLDTQERAIKELRFSGFTSDEFSMEEHLKYYSIGGEVEDIVLKRSIYPAFGGGYVYEEEYYYQDKKCGKLRVRNLEVEEGKIRATVSFEFEEVE